MKQRTAHLAILTIMLIAAAVWFVIVPAVNALIAAIEIALD